MNNKPPCNTSVSIVPPGMYLGHVLPGAFMLAIGACLCVEIGLRSRWYININKTNILTNMNINMFKQHHPKPILSIPLALAIVTVCIIGIFLEINDSWWDTSRPECFRAKVQTYNVSSSVRAKLSECAVYPLRGNVNNNGHSEHQALYSVCSLPAILSLLHQGAQYMTSVMAQKKQQQQQQHHQQHEEKAPVLHVAAIHVTEEAREAPPTALLERFGFIGCFYASYLLWTNHASAMVMNPCWDLLSTHVMSLNRLWHVLLSNINLFSAGIAATTLLNTSRLDSALAIGILFIWQGLTFFVIANAMYAGDDGPVVGRWLPNPRWYAFRDSSLCKKIENSCFLHPKDLDVGSMKGHAVALVCMLMLLSGIVGTILSLVGWWAGDLYCCCCCSRTCCSRCGKMEKKKKNVGYEMVKSTDTVVVD